MTLPSLLKRLLSPRQVPAAAVELAQRSRREILGRTVGFNADSVAELRGYVRARALPVVLRNTESYLAGEGKALAGERDTLLEMTLDKATHFVLTELRQALRTPGRKWKAA